MTSLKKNLFVMTVGLTLGACSSNPATPDAPAAIDAGTPDAVVIDATPPDATVTPTGTHYQYVADSLTLPSSSSEATADGLDLNGDGTVDNKLGSVLASFSGQGFNFQDTVTKSVDDGTTILLGDLQTGDFTTASAVGFSSDQGANPVPAACTDANDTVCRHQFDGSATFDIAADNTINPPLVGSITDGTFTTGPGNITVQVALTGGAPIALSLIGARVKFTGISATGITHGILAGALPKTELDNTIYPALATQLQAYVTSACTNTPANGDCGCPSGSSASTLIGILDTNMDCAITTSDLVTNNTVNALFAPDITIDGMPCLSLGVAVTYVAGTFTEPTSGAN